MDLTIPKGVNEPNARVVARLLQSDLPVSTERLQQAPGTDVRQLNRRLVPAHAAANGDDHDVARRVVVADGGDGRVRWRDEHAAARVVSNPRSRRQEGLREQKKQGYVHWTHIRHEACCGDVRALSGRYLSDARRGGR
ncbi:MAG: hypothetical protein ACE5O2_04380 [Armatimonadota bacterium]